MGALEPVAKTDFSFLLEEGLGSREQSPQQNTKTDCFSTRSSYQSTLSEGRQAKYKDPRFPDEPDVVVG